jgi:hypothetical protein
MDLTSFLPIAAFIIGLTISYWVAALWKKA